MRSGRLPWVGRYSSSNALVTPAHHRVKGSRIGIQISCTFSQMEFAKFGEVVISNAAELEKKKNAIRASGPAKLQVIADFDMTLTKCWVDGKRGQSSHALLKQGNAEYDLKRRRLYDYYRPLEVCPTIAIDEKTKLMEEWWEKTHALLVEGGLNYAAIRNSVTNSAIDFRDGVVQLFEILEKIEVPVLIFSAGLADIIEEVMRQKLHKNFKNVKVVSNRMVFDIHGNLVGFKGKTIHVLNKNEHALEMAAPVHEKLGNNNGVESDANGASVVKDRTNVLLLGDHIGDLGMSDGLDFENCISVAFLNENVEKSMDIYKQAYDIVLPNDAPMWEVVNLVKELCL
ncbi:hypothetical protein SUGI_0631060 [Cryptomeria japonica]|uniref:uncharacterized protein LOC131037544 isoform X2 n=1 Tax=Cryptomeria japonica TaxID=3369 RepID=UPI002414C144|nr:uncharacterized protein LOC131037544 isoform X2 [Cryptomeria japonica]GLJ31445.1 hypothetical protein SUGI_0631060 [Cryptomeria japonica]